MAWRTHVRDLLDRQESPIFVVQPPDVADGDPLRLALEALRFEVSLQLALCQSRGYSLLDDSF